MLKPAFAFDGRLILDHAHLHDIGFQVEAVGKIVSSGYPLPLTPTLSPMTSFALMKTPDLSSVCRIPPVIHG